MIYTSRFTNPELEGDKYYTVGITLGYPKFKLKFTESEHCFMLAPDRSMWGKTREEFAELYKAKLDKLGEGKIRWKLDSFVEKANGKDVVLLCYEDVRDPEQNCHRTVFADWCRERFGADIRELTDSSPVKYKKPRSVEKKESVQPAFEQMCLFA